MTTILIENVDKLTFPHLPPIIYTDSQGSYQRKYWAGRYMEDKGWVDPIADHNVKKIHEVCGGWITGSGSEYIVSSFATLMMVDLWDKPYWDYSTTVIYVTKLGQVYHVIEGDGSDDETKQGWIWTKLEGKAGRYFTTGSGGDFAADAYDVKHLSPESAIKYAAKFDPFTNDIIQCNIDFREYSMNEFREGREYEKA